MEFDEVFLFSLLAFFCLVRCLSNTCTKRLWRGMFCYYLLFFHQQNKHNGAKEESGSQQPDVMSLASSPCLRRICRSALFSPIEIYSYVQRFVHRERRLGHRAAFSFSSRLSSSPGGKKTKAVESVVSRSLTLSDESSGEKKLSLLEIVGIRSSLPSSISQSINYAACSHWISFFFLFSGISHCFPFILGVPIVSSKKREREREKGVASFHLLLLRIFLA